MMTKAKEKKYEEIKMMAMEKQALEKTLASKMS